MVLRMSTHRISDTKIEGGTIYIDNRHGCCVRIPKGATLRQALRMAETIAVAAGECVLNINGEPPIARTGVYRRIPGTLIARRIL
jgi:hypothetical protein